MRRVDGCHERLKIFFYQMNHPLPVNEKNYRKITSVVNVCVKKVAEQVMLEAAEKLRGENTKIQVAQLMSGCRLMELGSA